MPRWIMDSAQEAEFEHFIHAVAPRLFRSAYALTGDYQLAEDALQAAFAAAYSSWKRVQQADLPEAYVRRMVFNQVMSWRRRHAWSSERSSAQPPDSLALSHEQTIVDFDEVWQALAQLPRRQRAVVVLRYYDDLSEADIATALGIRPGTVKSQCAAGMRTLRRLLDPDRHADHSEAGQIE
jgi:RNA polymerase sigma-70 factor (sigma-E family)